MIKIYVQKKLDKVRLLFRLHRYEKAERVLANLIEDFPGRPEEQHFHALKAVSLQKQGKREEAIELLRGALEKNPQSSELSLCLSACLADSGAYEEARQAYLQVEGAKRMREAQESLKATFHLASYELHKFYGAHDSAISDFNQFQALSTPSLQADLDFAQTYLDAKRFRDASQLLQKVVAKNPASTAGHTLLGLAYFSEGKMANAKDAWKKTLELNPQAKDARVFLDIMSICDR